MCPALWLQSPFKTFGKRSEVRQNSSLNEHAVSPQREGSAMASKKVSQPEQNSVSEHTHKNHVGWRAGTRQPSHTESEHMAFSHNR